MELQCLWAFEEDIKSRSWLDWLSAHASFSKPLHRYEGMMNVKVDRLNFIGVDKRLKENVELDVYKYQIEQLHLGYDDTFNALETRGLGILWVPLRLSFTQNNEEKKLYLIVNYHLGRADNKDCFEFLKAWVKR